MTLSPQSQTPQRDAAPRPTTAWGYTSLLLFLYALNWTDKAVLGLAAQPLAREFGLTTAQIGLLGSAFYLAFAISGFFAGALQKRFSAKWALALLVTTWALAMFAPMLAVGGFALLLAARVVLGLGEGPAGALLVGAIYSWHPHAKRGFPSTIATGMPSVAKIALAPVLALIIAQWGWRWAFGLLAIMTIAWVLIWIPLWKDGPYGRASAAGEGAGAAEGPDVPLRKVLLTRTFIGASTAMFATYSIISAMITFLPTYFEVGVGFSQTVAGSLLGVVGVFTLLTALPTGLVTDRAIQHGSSSRLVRGILSGVVLIVGGAFFGFLLTQPSQWVAVAFYIVGFSLINISNPLLTAGISEICPPRQTSAILGIFMGIHYFGALITPAVVGYIVDAAPDPATGWGRGLASLGVLAALGGVAALALFNPPRDARRLMGDAT
ncbi:MFS transporter [Nocardioides sp. NPDC047086]|uniref:MFS transporter n=1 Tax=Nocardioides sp. NPDC047086 TaxID=3154810 RepID=UPI0033F15FBB